jgi:outer membrane protein insertion porin family
MRLTGIRIEGATRTRSSFLGSLVYPYLHKTNPEPQTLGSILHDARGIGSLLQETDIFSSVLAKVEQSREPRAQPGDVELVFKTHEKPRMYLKTSTEFGNNEGGAVRIRISLSFPCRSRAPTERNVPRP